MHKPFSRQEFCDVFTKASKLAHLKKEKIQFEVAKELYEYKKIILEDKASALKDLLDNMAHHWREPLSIISTAAGALQIDYEFGNNNIQHHKDMLEKIVNTTQDMSNTIYQFSKCMESNER